jgi:AcrR family transcriptional regulator
MICAAAGIDRGEFDRLYADKQDCFVQAFKQMSARYEETVFGAYEEHSDWRDGFRAAAYAAARWVRDHPAETRFGTVALWHAGPNAREAYKETVTKFIAMVDGGREGPGALENIPPGTAERVLGSITQTLAVTLQEGDTTEDAERIVPQLMFIAVSAYRGTEAAEKELKIPPPPE